MKPQKPEIISPLNEVFKNEVMAIKSVLLLRKDIRRHGV